MNKKLKDVENLKKNLKSMNWDKLANDLIDLEMQFDKNKKDLSKSEKNTVNLLILLYEEEKASRIEKTINATKFFEDEQLIAYDWTNDIIDD